MIRRKWLSVCIALVLCLLLLPAAALAADGDSTVYVGGVELTSTNSQTVYATTDDSGAVITGSASESNYNIKWDGSTLTLRNATIKEAGEYASSESMAVYRASGDLAIVLVGENTVDAPGDGSVSSCGIHVGSGSLTISGEENASLNVSGGDSSTGTSYGIHAYDTITINSSTVNATSGQATGDSVGIFAESGSNANSITINGGTVTATAGNVVGGGWYSCGIRVEGTITINNGTVTATGGYANGSSNKYSVGILATKDMTISRGNVTGIGGAGMLSCGIIGNDNLRITGGTVVGTGGPLAGENSEYSGGVHGRLSVEITGGTVTGTGGDTEVGDSFGICTGDASGQRVTITGGTVTATGGTATDGNSSGIYAGNTRNGNIEVTISGGTVTATGGAAGNGSYGILAETTGTDKSAEVTINGNSVVRANMTGEEGVDGEPISATTTTQENSIVFENGVGTVYNDVTLQEDLTVAAGETLTIPQDAALTIPDGTTLTNSGTITNKGTIINNGALNIEQGGTLTGEVTGNPVVCTVTVQTDGNGSASASATTAAAGTTVTLTAKPDNGYRLARWEVVEGDVTISGNSFTMPAENVTVRAVFSPIVNIPDTYDIDLIVGEGGEAKTSLTNASEGSTIIVTATPDAGYELDYITVDGEWISGTTFKMPAHDVTVRVYFTDGAALPFTDVSAGAWYFDAVSYVYVGGLMDGVSDTLFDPDGTMTRAMVWAILARVDGETVTGEDWIETAREWAVANGVSDGENANGYVTREQFATMLWRYASGKGYDVSIGEDTNILSYADFADLSEYAIPAMQWACGAGVITGVTDATLVPQGEATRAQCAAMLMRFVEAIG